MVHHLQIIGESAASLGRSFHAAHPEAPWAQIVAMRNVLVHGYFGIDLEEVWQVIARDLPQFKEVVERILAGLNQT